MWTVLTRVHEQAPLTAPVTSRIRAEESTATKHHPLLLSLSWEPLPNSVGTTYTFLGSLPHPTALQTGVACATSPQVTATLKGSANRHCLRAPYTASSPWQHQHKDKSLHKLRKEIASTQTKGSPHTKRKKKKALTKYPGVLTHINSPPRLQ